MYITIKIVYVRALQVEIECQCDLHISSLQLVFICAFVHSFFSFFFLFLSLFLFFHLSLFFTYGENTQIAGFELSNCISLFTSLCDIFHTVWSYRECFFFFLLLFTSYFGFRSVSKRLLQTLMRKKQHILDIKRRFSNEMTKLNPFLSAAKYIYKCKNRNNWKCNIKKSFPIESLLSKLKMIVKNPVNSAQKSQNHT